MPYMIVESLEMSDDPHNGDLSLGNLYEQSLEHILASPRAQALYQGFTHHTAVEPLCQRCGYSAVSKQYRSLSSS